MLAVNADENRTGTQGTAELEVGQDLGGLKILQSNNIGFHLRCTMSSWLELAHEMLFLSGTSEMLQCLQCVGTLTCLGSCVCVAVARQVQPLFQS